MGQHGWYSGQSTHYLPMKPGFKSRMSCYIVGQVCSWFLLAPLFSRPSGFALSSKTKISKFQCNLELVIDKEPVFGNPTTKSLFFI